MGVGVKSKRKDIDQVNDDFSDFSLSSPATKIRRLDAELPPIVEDDEDEPNQERAIVLFNPPQPLLPNNDLSLSLNPDLISGFKNQLLRASQMKCGNFEETECDKRRQMEMERCLAVVPWVPSQIPSVNENESLSVDGEQEVPESMEADEMDMEEENNNNNSSNSISGNGSSYEYGFGGFHHLPPPPQQQHCMIPHPPENLYTPPITWS